MKRLFLAIISCLLFVQSGFSQDRSIGVNMADLSNFSSQIVFVDIMKQSSTWLAQPVDESSFSVEGATVPLGPNGYPTHVPFELNGQMLQPHVSVLNSQPGEFLYPLGEYTLFFEGTGEIVVRWDVVNGPFTATTPNTPHTFQVEPTTLGLNIVIISSNAQDPIRNIRLILPGYSNTYEDEPFHPTFLDLLEPFEAIRFMKPLAVEENLVSEWEDRTRLENYTYVTDETEQIRFGMPYELVIDLANQLNKDIWVNVPPFANTEYIEEMASIFASRLENGINLYVEYSNESWNTLYPLTRQFMIDQGRAMGFGDDETEANVRYHAFRSFQIWDEFKAAFGDRSDQIREVLGSQSFVDVGRISIDAIKDPVINPGGTIPHSIAVASYMGIELIDQMISEFGECGFSGEMILDRLEATAPGEIAEYMEQFQFWSDSTGIEVVAYEGGQHLLVGNFGLNPDCVAEAIANANRSARMQALFCAYFDLWYDQYDGGLFMSFLLAESYGTGGSFGILESTLQTPETSAKWTAHAMCAFSDASEIEIVGLPSFEPTALGEMSSSSFEIRNVGTSDLVVTQITFPEGFFGDWTAGTISSGNSQTVNVNFRPTEERIYTGSIRIQYQGGEELLTIEGEGQLVTGSDNIFQKNNITHYPNPTSGFINLDLTAISGPVSGQVLTDLGVTKKTFETTGGKTYQVSLKNLADGLYFLQIVGSNFNMVRKVILNKN